MKSTSAFVSSLLCVINFLDVQLLAADNRDCQFLLSALNENIHSPDQNLYKIRFDHSYLDITKGYVPDIKYSLIISVPPSASFKELILTSLSVRHAKLRSIGTFDNDKNFNATKCKLDGRESENAEFLLALPNEEKELTFPIAIFWTAPHVDTPDCALFKVGLRSTNVGRWTVLNERICKNRGAYHFIRGQSGQEEFLWQGSTTQVLMFEALRLNQVYGQIIKASYTGPVSKGNCVGASMRISTASLEKNFTSNSHRLCIGHSISDQTNIFKSVNGLIILEAALPLNGNLSFILSYYNLPTENGCNQTIMYRKTGAITSPNYPENYYSGMDCYYTIRVEKDERIFVRFLEFQVNRLSSPLWPSNCVKGDYFEIATTRLCGYENSNYQFQSSNNIFMAHFHADTREYAESQKLRFKLIWHAKSSCPLEQKFFGTQGRITSGNYPEAYLNNQNCSYLVEVPRGLMVQLRFRDLRLEPVDRRISNCQNLSYAHDYVIVGNTKLCGNWTGLEDTLVFRSNTNLIHFAFVSDQWTTPSGGFAVEFRAVTPNETDECRSGRSYFEGVCYDVKDYAVDWQTAGENCQSGNGQLASVHSSSIQTFLNQLLISIDDKKDKAYWIGGNDLQYEGDFVWVGGKRIEYSNWFPGWPEFSNYNKQPNDDGLSSQNCLEMRRRFSHPSKGFGETQSFYWNDRDCNARNGFICEYPKIGSDRRTLFGNAKEKSCNETITLTSSLWRANVASPNYPNSYPDFINCYITIDAVPPGQILILDFNKFLLEFHDQCEYDYLEIWEETVSADPVISSKKRYCGDQGEELKLLRRIVADRKIILHFASDHSRGFTGYHFSVYVDDSKLSRTLNLCNDKNWHNFDDHCYLFVQHPMVDWNTARDTCASSGHTLALPETGDEENFLIEQILKAPDHNVGEIFWLGARQNLLIDEWALENKKDHFNYTDWYSTEFSSDDNFIWQATSSDKCLTIQQQFPVAPGSNAFATARRPFWGRKSCDEAAGYICKALKPLITEGQILNDTFTSSNSGVFTLPGFPAAYPNFFEYTVRIYASENTRILIRFQWIDIEYQKNCKYDFLELRTFEDDVPLTLCGKMENKDFASYSSQALIRFHSDHSITGKGFLAHWQVINISNCYVDADKTSGFIKSVNFPRFYLNALDCSSTITAPLGARVVLDFLYFDVGTETEDFSCPNTDYVSIFLEQENSDHRVRRCGKLLTSGASKGLLFISYSNKMRISFHSDSEEWGVGFNARHDAFYGNQINQSIFLYPNESTHSLLSPNYPLPYPVNLCVRQLYHVPYNYQMIIDFQEIDTAYHRIDNDMIFLRDAPDVGYATNSGNFSLTTYWNRFTLDVCSNDSNANGGRYKAMVTIAEDDLFWKNKTVSNYSGLIESCDPSPCRNGAVCESSPDGYVCRCTLSYLGAFCHLSQCDFRPCLYGQCEVTLTAEKFYCHCQLGYTGKHCEVEIHACESNPCHNGKCVESLGTFRCECNDGYRGVLCEKKNLFDAETLRESFLRDPFWLGLFLVLGVIGLVGVTHCLRKRLKYSGFARVQDEEDATRAKEKRERESQQEQAAALLNSFTTEGDKDDDKDGEVYFSLQDLGIGPSHYRNLGHFEKVTFKLKLADLSEQELELLESYLEHVTATMEGRRPTCEEEEGGMKTPPFANAMESVTGLILKSAEIVDHQQLRELQEERAKTATRQQCPWAKRTSICSPGRQALVIRGAAEQISKLIRRPRSVEFGLKGSHHNSEDKSISFALQQLSPELLGDNSHSDTPC